MSDMSLLEISGWNGYLDASPYHGGGRLAAIVACYGLSLAHISRTTLNTDLRDTGKKG